jgi:sugar lactone lactonase YvrE
MRCARHSLLKLMCLACLICASASAQNIYTVVGLPYSHRASIDGQQALSAPLDGVYGLLFDKLTGRLLFHDSVLVERLEPNGSLLAIAGLGENQDSSSADGTLASGLQIVALRGMAEDATGNLYLGDAAAGRVYRVALDGTVTTFAGGGPNGPGSPSDGGPATAARLTSPRGMAFDSQGNLDIVELFCTCIRRVSPTGIISTIYTGPTNPYGLAQQLEGLAIDAQDNLYLTEFVGHQVLKIGANGSVTVIAGTGVGGFSGDSGPATAAQLNGPTGVALGPDGSVYISDSLKNRVRKVAPDGTISTIAGIGPADRLGGFSGDGGPAVSAQLSAPAELLLDSSGNLYVADFGNARVRVISSGGIITTIAGSGRPDLPPVPANGDGGPAITANIQFVAGAAFDPLGNLYITDSFSDQIRKVAPNGTISTLVGPGQFQLSNPGPIISDASGNLYVITSDSRIWKITPAGIITLVAGTGTGTGTIRSQGDGGPAVSATLNAPQAVAIDAQGDIYIADTSNARLREINTSGIINTVAGPGQLGIDYYNSVAIDPQGNVYVAITHYDPANSNFYSVVDRLGPNGALTTIAGSGQTCIENADGNAPEEFPSDGLPATHARLCAVTGMAIDAHGIMYLSDGEYKVELRVNADGTIQRLAGSTLAFPYGDGGPAVQASLRGQDWSPGPATFDQSGNLYLPETGTSRIREVTATPYALTLSLDQIGLVGTQPQSWGVAISANFAEPFPYAVQVNGGSWLSVNRVTGLTGEPITVSLNPVGLTPGFYPGTVSVVLAGGLGQVNLPIELLVPSP